MLLPSTTTQWKTALGLAAGALAGFVVSPLLWPAFLFNPFLFMFSVLGMAAQESTWNDAATGDGGNSYGALQFNVGSWPGLTGLDMERARSAVLAGFFAARYVADALRASWGWWLIMVPVYGHALMRWMWTHGTSASAAKSGRTDAWAAAGAESHTWPGYRGLLVVFAVPVLAWSAALWKLLRRSK